MLYDVEKMSVVKLALFHGIELEEFPAHIAEVAMWMTEHLANIELGRTFGKVFAAIPLKECAHFVHGVALAIAWDGVLPREECIRSEDRRLGNECARRCRSWGPP